MRVLLASVLIAAACGAKVKVDPMPTGDLDDETASSIVHLIRSYVQTRNATLIVASHGHSSLRHFDQILMLNDGILSPVPQADIKEKPASPIHRLAR